MHGGVEISGFEPYRDGILRADFRGVGFPRDFSDQEQEVPEKFRWFQGDVPRFELFFRGERLDLARWPNRVPGHPRWGEWAYIPRTSEETAEYFHYPGTRPHTWKGPGEAQVHWFPWYNYRDHYVGVSAIDPPGRAKNEARGPPREPVVASVLDPDPLEVDCVDSYAICCRQSL